MIGRVRFSTSRDLLVFVLLVLLSFAWSAAPASAQDQKLVIFAAASLKDALDEVNTAYQHEKGQETATSYAASSTLAKQIEAAAPADVFISADLDWMDYLAKRNLIKPETRANLLGNRLVLIAPADSAAKLGIAPNFPLAQALGNGRLAIADPNGVPAGRYGKAALESLGVWSSVADRLAPAENVRATLLLVSRGEAPLGIVYQTDANSDKGVKIVGTFPAEYPSADHLSDRSGGRFDQSRRSGLYRLSQVARRPRRSSRSRDSRSFSKYIGAIRRKRSLDGGTAASVAGRGDGGAPQPARRFLGDDDEPDTGHPCGSGAGARAVLGKIAARRAGSSAVGHAAGGDRLPFAAPARPSRARSASSWTSISVSSSRFAGPARRSPVP